MEKIRLGLQKKFTNELIGEPDPSYKEDEKVKENEKEEDGEMDF